MTVRAFSRCFLLALSCLAIGALFEDAAGQVVRGHLIDFRTRTPVINGNVALRDSIGAVVARTATDDDGVYELKARTPGTYSLLAVGLGYLPGISASHDCYISNNYCPFI